MRPELQHIVDKAARVLGADTTLEDTDFNLIAYGTQRFEVDSVRRNSILQRHSTRPVREWFEQFGIARSSTPLRNPGRRGRGFRARICFPALWRGVTYYGYLWALDGSTPLEDAAVARGVQLAEHAAAYLAQLSRERDDKAYAVSDLISPDVDRVRRAVTRMEDRGLIDRRSPVVAVAVGALDEAVRHSLPQNPSTLSPNLWNLPSPVLADRGQRTTTLLVPLLTSRMTYPRWRRPPWRCSSTSMSCRRTGRSGSSRASASPGAVSWSFGRAGRKPDSAWVASAVPAVRPVARWADLGLYRLLALPQAELAC
jgi:hypothetical protein